MTAAGEAASWEAALSRLPPEVRELLGTCPPDKRDKLLQELLKLSEVDYRPLTERDVQAIKVGVASWRGGRVIAPAAVVALAAASTAALHADASFFNGLERCLGFKPLTMLPMVLGCSWHGRTPAVADKRVEPVWVPCCGRGLHMGRGHAAKVRLTPPWAGWAG